MWAGSALTRSGGRCEGRKPNGATLEQQDVIQKMLAWRKERKSFAEIAVALMERTTGC